MGWYNSCCCNYNESLKEAEQKNEEPIKIPSEKEAKIVEALEMAISMRKLEILLRERGDHKFIY